MNSQRLEKGFAIIDFGSQYTQLLARRLRELKVYSEVFPASISLNELKALRPKGIILSGGPSSVTAVGAPMWDVLRCAEIAPILGVCYGMQLIATSMGGEVTSSKHREYGRQDIVWAEPPPNGVPHQHSVWMSHGDHVTQLPSGFEQWGMSRSGVIAAFKSDRIWGVQFHPEVIHTEYGTQFLKAFVFDLCEAHADWQSQMIFESIENRIRTEIPKAAHIVCALSGGVDSTVVAKLLTEVLGPNQVHCVFVDTGFMRLNEAQEVREMLAELNLNLVFVNAQQEFMTGLSGVTDPEEKRKRIGHLFIDIFKKHIVKLGPVEYLAQGTLYPDVIESISLNGQSMTIKSHHNVGGLPKDLGLKLVEPVRELFKDEVRDLGRLLGLPAAVLARHPFPGPGLAIRIMGEVTAEKLDILKRCDAVFLRELKALNLYAGIWQAFAVLLPVYSVGVQGDGRTYGQVLALRAVQSVDAMTADWFQFAPHDLARISNAITNEVPEVTRVVYDITSKPPGTIEWE